MFLLLIMVLQFWGSCAKIHAILLYRLKVIKVFIRCWLCILNLDAPLLTCYVTEMCCTYFHESNFS